MKNLKTLEDNNNKHKNLKICRTKTWKYTLITNNVYSSVSINIEINCIGIEINNVVSEYLLWNFTA